MFVNKNLLAETTIWFYWKTTINISQTQLPVANKFIVFFQFSTQLDGLYKKNLILQYSRTLIYHSRIDRFPASTIRHFWSRIKFHINNVIYSRIHRSPNYCFPAFIVCKSTSRHRISRMDHLKKNWSEVFALHSLWTTNLATQ